MQAWADGSTNYGLRVYGTSESDSTTWRRFRSANYTTSGYAPKLTVTYNSYATTSALAISPSSVNAYSGKRYVTTYTPTLSAKVTDADGSTVKGQFEITNDPSYSGETAYSYTGTSASVASGGTAKLTIPSASQLAGAHLRMRVRGYDGTDYGAWSSYIYFVPNVAKPAAPTISCDPYSESTWTAKDDDGATCTLDTSSTDGMGFYWGLDDSSVPKRIYDTTDGNGGDPLTITIAPGADWHTLYAKTVDSGGNLSSTTTGYQFGVGVGVGVGDGAGLLTPSDGDTSARRVSLTSKGRTSYTGVTYQYRRGETDSWQSVPVTDVTRSSDASAVPSWPVSVTSGSPAALTWNVTTSLSQDGAIDIRAAFTDGTNTAYSQPHTISVDRDAGTAPASEVGPGELNALTGDFTVSATDASGFGLTVDRSASSRTPTAGSDVEGQAAIFGPQWSSGLTDDATDTDWTYLRKTSGTSAAVGDADGDETGFTATADGGWKPEPGSEDLTLTSKNSSGSTTNDLTKVSVFTLKDDEGTATTFKKTDSSTSTWQVSTIYTPSDNSAITVVSEKDPSGSLVRPKYEIAPTSAVSAATCESTPSTRGCRLLELVYAPSTTATGSTLGNYSGQVEEIREWSTAPGASTATAVPVAQYAYDTSGRLREKWDPRVTPKLKTTYAYDSAGRVTTLTPPGLLAWTLTYGKAGGAATAGDGMLLSLSRPNLTQGTKSTLDGTNATSSVVYDVPLSGSKAPYSMATSDVAAWGQSDAPTDATAVFPPDSVPASHTGSDLTSSDYKRATISYADASGQEVNTATPGGDISTTEYDEFGNTTRELSPANRELALATSGDALDELNLLGIAQNSTADRAAQLSTLSVYSGDGLRETDEYGPLHQITLTSALKAGSGGTDLAAGTRWPTRQHTVTSYDEGRPSDGSAEVADEPTTVKVGAYDTSKDARGVETSRTDSVAGTFAATYDADGDLATESLPGGYTLTVGEDETGALTSRVYTRDSDSAVVASDTVDRSVQDEEIADSDTSGTTRSRQYSYDMAGRLARADETNSDGSCTRRDYAFDKNSNRKTLTTATSDVGTDCSSTGATTTSYTYDSADRLETTGTVYDAFGRTTTQATGTTVGYYANDLVRQQTANGKRQTWTLDAAGRLASWTTETQGSDSTWTQTGAKTNHFSGDDDTPDWTAEDTSGTITRSVLDLDDDLGAITTGTGNTVLQLTDIHGDVTVQLPLDTSKSAVALAFDEFGNLEGDTAATRYGWLGAAQRASDTVTGAMLMGVRLYDPTSGRFLSTDPVPGGSANAYDYANQDPLNQNDLSGRCPACAIAIPEIVFIFGVAAVIAFIWLYYQYCKAVGCNVVIPVARPIPLPKYHSKTQKKTKNTKYIVYEIYWKFKGHHHTYKYGISRVGGSRPRSQLGSCKAYSGRTCHYKIKKTVKGFYYARIAEAGYITMYAWNHGHCPPGQLKSCR